MESRIMHMIPFGRLYVPLEFQHYNRFYTNRAACCLSVLALSIITAVIYYEFIKVGDIITTSEDWQHYVNYKQLQE